MKIFSKLEKNSRTNSERVNIDPTVGNVSQYFVERPTKIGKVFKSRGKTYRKYVVVILFTHLFIMFSSHDNKLRLSMLFYACRFFFIYWFSFFVLMDKIFMKSPK